MRQNRIPEGNKDERLAHGTNAVAPEQGDLEQFMETVKEFTSAAESALRKQMRVLAVLAGVCASGAVMIPQFLPPKLNAFDRGVDPMAVFLGLSFLTFAIGVATPIYAYAKSVKIGARMPAAAFAPLAMLLAAIIGMAVIAALRSRTREVEFTPKPRPPIGTQSVE